MMMPTGGASSKVITNALKSREIHNARACPRGRAGVRLHSVMPDATIHTLGTLLEHLNPVLYRVSLPNGKEILAHLSKPLTEEEAVFPPGTVVILEMTPYDFETARILGEAEG